jgi:branched-chain amino acid transport system ATP-binding protein
VPRLEVDQLSKSFGGVAAVRALSMSLDEGEILGLIGPNGAGKTTAFNLIAGFERPDRGVVRFGGRDITGKAPHRISQLGITRTFQTSKPFPHLTALENVMIGALAHGADLPAARRAAGDALVQVGLSARGPDRASDLPVEGQRMLELARALATRPKLLLLDEVMGGLTTGEIDRVMDRLRDVRRQGIAIIIVEHVMRAIMKISDRVVVMNFGEKIAEGTPADIVADPRVHTAYLGRSRHA